MYPTSQCEFTLRDAEVSDRRGEIGVYPEIARAGYPPRTCRESLTIAVAGALRRERRFSQSESF